MNGTQQLGSVSTHEEMLSQAIARRLRGLIAERRISSSEVARAIGMTQQAFSRRMTGRTPLTLDELEVLADVLDQSIVWILTGQHSAPHPEYPGEGLCAQCAVRELNPQPADIETTGRRHDLRLVHDLAA